MSETYEIFDQMSLLDLCNVTSSQELAHGLMLCDKLDGQTTSQSGTCSEVLRPGPVNGFWANADWIGCTDGKWRPVKPGISALAHGATNRVVKLRGLGNGIVSTQAQAFIEAYMQA